MSFERSFAPVLALHAGAGTIAQDADPSWIDAHKAGLTLALQQGQAALEKGACCVDVVELVVCILEDDPHFNAGKGAVYSADQKHELDAAIMRSQGRACGAVAGTQSVAHPISLARAVMEHSRHVFFVGQGADRFAKAQGMEQVDPAYFGTEHRQKAFERAKARALAQPLVPAADDEKRGTVGAVVLDKHGELAAGTSTGGLTYKQPGRVGDTPVIGAGTYADKHCAVSCTGTGEEYIRYNVAHELSARMRYLGEGIEMAAQHLVHQVLSPGDGGLIAVDAIGQVSMPFNTLGMYRGVADLKGRFEIQIWGGGPNAAPTPVDH